MTFNHAECGCQGVFTTDTVYAKDKNTEIEFQGYSFQGDSKHKNSDHGCSKKDQDPSMFSPN